MPETFNLHNSYSSLRNQPRVGAMINQPGLGLHIPVSNADTGPFDSKKGGDNGCSRRRGLRALPAVGAGPTHTGFQVMEGRKLLVGVAGLESGWRHIR